MSKPKRRNFYLYINSALLLLLCSALVYVLFVMPKSDSTTPPLSPEPEQPAADVDNQALEQQPTTPGPQVTILLLGLDQRGLSDAIVLVSYNIDTAESAIVSLKRDTYVPFQTWSEKGRGHDALGWASYAGMDYGQGSYLDGARYMTETVEQLLDIKINFYAATTFGGLVKLIDLIGGVTLYVRPAFTTKYGSQLQGGTQTLNGEQALLFARHRQHPRIPEPGSLSEDGDRIIRNQQLLKAVLERCRTLSADELLSAYEMLEDDLHTNMTDWDLLELINIFYNSEQQTVSQAVLPGTLKKVYENVIEKDIEYYFLDEAASAEILTNLGIK